MLQGKTNILSQITNVNPREQTRISIHWSIINFLIFEAMKVMHILDNYSMLVYIIVEALCHLRLVEMSSANEFCDLNITHPG